MQRPDGPTPSPSEPSGPPLGASGSAIVQRSCDISMWRRSPSSWIIASRSGSVSSASWGPSPRSERVVGDSSARCAAPRAISHCSSSSESGPSTRALSRRAVPSGPITSIQAASATPGTSRSTSRPSASSMSAAPSVIRAASASRCSWRFSASAARRASSRAWRSRAPQTAIAEPETTVISGRK